MIQRKRDFIGLLILDFDFGFVASPRLGEDTRYDFISFAFILSLAQILAHYPHRIKEINQPSLGVY